MNVKVDATSFDDSIVDEFQKIILLFADDTLLLANTVAELQLLLNKLTVYCKPEDHWSCKRSPDISANYKHKTRLQMTVGFFSTSFYFDI